MPKGNHVFNHFNKTIENAFKGLIDAAGIRTEMGVAINLKAAKVAPLSQDAAALSSRLPKAWLKFKEIASSAPFMQWDEMQDSEEVAEDDANSVAYGRAAAAFTAEIVKIAFPATRAGARPGAHWMIMLKTGYDGAAAARFIAAGGKDRQRREAQVEGTRLWVKGSLNALVSTWIHYLKLDMDGKK